MTNEMKLNNLQGIRFIGFVLIFLTHSYFIITDNKLFDYGARGVEIFFVLSGYLIAYNHSDKEIKSSFKDSLAYVYKKIKKFYPLHIFTFALFFFTSIKHVLKGTETANTLSEILVNGFLNITLLKSWYLPAAFSFNGVSWFLSTILFIYLCIPKIITVLKNKNKSQIFLVFLSILLLKIFIDTLGYKLQMIDTFFLYISSVYRILDVLLGYLSYLLLKDNSLNFSFAINSLIQVFTVLICCVSFVLFDKEWIPALFILLMIAAIHILRSDNGVMKYLLGNKVVVNLGNISFELFILHVTVIVFLRKIFGLDDSTPYIYFIAAFITTVILSELYHYRSKIKVLVRNKINR